MDLIYPDFACGADYLPEDSFVLWAESGRCMEAARHFLWRVTEDVTTLVDAGALGPKGPACADPGKLAHTLAERHPNLYLDTFLTSGYPVSPRDTVTFSCRQLPGFGTSLETAASDPEALPERRDGLHRPLPNSGPSESPLRPAPGAGGLRWGWIWT